MCYLHNSRLSSESLSITSILEFLHAGMKSIAGSVTGGTKDIQEMLDFCAKERVYPNIEVIPIQYINEALERMINKDVKYRFVIDIENSLVSN
jgi:cinnamyl-alcohol dehydrogenase